MASSKKYMLPQIRSAAQKGDRILQQIINKWVKHKGLSRQYPDLCCYLQSNKVISTFHTGIRHKTKAYTCIGKKGDYVEAWIYFLYINYGKEAVERYLIKNIKQHLNTITI